MILRSIHVRGWKCFAEPLTVGPFGEGLNLIHGPNGSGKSTLLWAALRALFDNHKVGGEKAHEELRCWGRDLNPLVRIEFEHDGQGYAIEKQFLKEHFSRLSQRNGSAWRLLAEGDAATHRVREMLAATPPGSGLSSAAHWGLAQVLWAPQGQLPLDGLAGTTQDRIRASLGAQVAGPGVQRILQQIHAAYGQVYTGKGKLRTGAGGAEIVSLREEEAQAQAQRDRLARDVEDFESASRRIEELRSVAQQFLSQLDDVQQRRHKAAEQLKRYEELVQRQKLEQEKFKAAEAQHAALKTRIDNLKQARVGIAEQREKLAQLAVAAPLLEQEAHRCRQEAEQQRLALQTVKLRRTRLQALAQRRDRAREYLDLRSRLAALDDVLRKLAAAEGQWAAARQQRSAIAAPDRETLKKIRAAAQRRDDARRSLEASLITLTLTPERPLQVESLASAAPGTEVLEPGQPRQFQGSPEVLVRIAGVGTVRATGPAGDVDQWQAALEAAQQALDALTAPFGERDVERLQQRRDQADELENQMAAHRAAVDALGGDQSSDDLAQQRAALAARREAILQAEPDWSAGPPEADTLASLVETADFEQRRAEDAAHAAQQAAASALQAAETRHQAALKDVAALQADVAALEKRRAELEADGLDDAARAQQLQRHAREMLLAETALGEAQESLAGFGADPRGELADLEAQLVVLRREAAAAEKSVSQLEGELKAKAAEGAYSALAEVEDRLASLAEKIGRQQLENAAIKLLYETVEMRRRQAVEEVVAPVAQRATSSLQRIAGPRFCEIRFEESFVPGGVAPRMAAAPVDLVRLSGGEQEQVHFAVRLALADVVAGGQRQLLVLDDALVNTDPGRMSRIRTILKETAQRFQVLILSCHPELYASLVDEPYRFNLEELAK